MATAQISEPPPKTEPIRLFSLDTKLPLKDIGWKLISTTTLRICLPSLVAGTTVYGRIPQSKLSTFLSTRKNVSKSLFTVVNVEFSEEFVIIFTDNGYKFECPYDTCENLPDVFAISKIFSSIDLCSKGLTFGHIVNICFATLKPYETSKYLLQVPLIAILSYIQDTGLKIMDYTENLEILYKLFVPEDFIPISGLRFWLDLLSRINVFNNDCLNGLEIFWKTNNTFFTDEMSTAVKWYIQFQYTLQSENAKAKSVKF
jgi:hypothetical protein